MSLSCPSLELPWSLKVLLCRACPHSFLPSLRSLLFLSVLLLEFSKLSTCFGFVNRSISRLEHLLTHILPEEKPPHPYGSHNTFILVPLVDVCSYATIQDIILKPCKCFCRIGLGRLAEVGTLRSIDSCYPYAYLRKPISPCFW